MPYYSSGTYRSDEGSAFVDRSELATRKTKSRDISQSLGRSLPKSEIISDDRVFAIRCEPLDPLRSLKTTRGLSLFVSQCIQRNGRKQMWDSIIVHCDEELDGTLAVQILISNPDWPELVQIACIRSRPDDKGCLTPLACNLDHIAESKAPRPT